MEKKHGEKATQVAKNSEMPLFASNRFSSDTEASGIMERQYGEKATQVARTMCFVSGKWDQDTKSLIPAQRFLQMFR